MYIFVCIKNKTLLLISTQHCVCHVPRATHVYYLYLLSTTAVDLLLVHIFDKIVYLLLLVQILFRLPFFKRSLWVFLCNHRCTNRIDKQADGNFSLPCFCFPCRKNTVYFNRTSPCFLRLARAVSSRIGGNPFSLSFSHKSPLA